MPPPSPRLTAPLCPLCICNVQNLVPAALSLGAAESTQLRTNALRSSAQRRCSLCNHDPTNDRRPWCCSLPKCSHQHRHWCSANVAACRLESLAWRFVSSAELASAQHRHQHPHQPNSHPNSQPYRHPFLLYRSHSPLPLSAICQVWPRPLIRLVHLPQAVTPLQHHNPHLLLLLLR